MKTTVKDLTMKSSKALSCITDLNHDSISLRQKIKYSFIECDKAQMISYINDLEKTVLINKQIIEDLLDSIKTKESAKKVIGSLNKENKRLNVQLKNTTKQRNTLQSQLLMSEQIIAELKGTLSNCKEQMKEKHKELLDQLNRKEYVVQNTLRKLDKAVTVLSKYKNIDNEVKSLIENLNLKKSNITNVVEQNEILASEMKRTKLKMGELESRLKELASGIGLKQRVNSFVAEGVNTQSSIELKRLLNENKELKEEVANLSKVNKSLKSALNDLQVKNESLSNKITSLTEDSNNTKSIIEQDNKKSIPNIATTYEGEVKVRDSFDALSTIKGEIIAEFFSYE